MSEIKIRLFCRFVVGILLAIIGGKVVSTYEGSLGWLMVWSSAFICVLLIAIVWILKAYKEMLEEKLKEEE